MNSEFVPRLQTVSGCLSLLNSSLLLAVGVAFLGFPRWVVSVLLDYRSNRYLHHEDPIDSAASLIGGVLVSQGLACLLLLYPMISEGFSPPSLASINRDQNGYSELAIWNVRTSVTMQLITGLLWIVVALYDDRSNESVVEASRRYEFGIFMKFQNEDSFVGAHRRTTIGLLLVGFVILVLGCFSMMLTFWPVTNLNQLRSRRGATTTTSVEEDLALENNLTEPLLERGEEIQNTTGGIVSQGDREDDDQNDEHDTREDEGQGDQVLQCNNDLEENRTDEEEIDEENHVDGPTSRIRGTKRLLAVAAPQVVYLYIGCITLLIRLPFSLSIPHFVSKTLGALADREFDRARREIIWLFILGTIDAFLDFWCIFCKWEKNLTELATSPTLFAHFSLFFFPGFGYANQRIVREIRIDTFFSILKQDIGFFDGQTSGELASRLNSDCGEMAGDLVSKNHLSAILSFRFLD